MPCCKHLALIALIASPRVMAHATEPTAGVDAWGAGEVLAASGLALTAALYAIGTRRRRAKGWRDGVWIRTAWWLGWATLGLAMFSPIDRWSAELFSIHMVQHEVLMIVAAPLLVLGKPGAMFAAALPRQWLRSVARVLGKSWFGWWRWLTLPAIAWSIHALVLWGWHIPVLFEAGLRSDTVHDVQHMTFLGSALLFWWAILRRRTHGGAIVYVFTTMLHTGVLGMLLTFASVPWYASYANTTFAWGLSPLEDQQIGGLIMWVPSGALLIGAGLMLASMVLARPGNGDRTLPGETAKP